MKHLLIAVLMLFTSSVLAFSGSHGSTQAQGGAGGAGGAGGTGVGVGIGVGFGGNAASNATARAISKQGQIQGQQQQMGQQQGQVSNQIGLQGISNVGNTVFTGRKNLRNAPSFGLPFMAPTAICQGTLAGGFSFWLGGAAGAGTYTIDLCMQMETIRVGVYMLQNATTPEHIKELQQANKEIYCIMKWAKPTSMCANPEAEVTASVEVETLPVVSVVEPKKVASIPDVSIDPHPAKIWFFGL